MAPLSAGLLETYMSRFELKKDEILQQKEAFDVLDPKDTGKIKMEALQTFNSSFLAATAFSEAELSKHFRETDADGNFGITFLEYLKVYVKGTYGREVHLGLEHVEEAVRDLQASDLQRTPRSRAPSVDKEAKDRGLPAIKEDRVMENQPPKRIEEAVSLPDIGGVDMKLSRKNTAGAYIRSARLFLKGGEGKAPVSALRISALGEAINSAIAVAVKMEEEGLGRITKVSTAYPDMPNGRGCAQICVDVERVG